MILEIWSKLFNVSLILASWLNVLLLRAHALFAHSLLCLDLCLTTCGVLSLIGWVLCRTLHYLTTITIIFVRCWIKNEIKIIHVKELEIAKTVWAIALIAIITKETIFIVVNDRLASTAADWVRSTVWADHGLACFILLTWFVPVNAFLFHAEAKPLLGSSEPH